MTVEVTDSRERYATDGTSTTFAIGFYFLANSHLQVVYTNSAGVETTLTLTTDYSVTGAGDENGGSITTVSTYASGGYITIVRDVPVTQLTDYVSQDAFPAESHEAALDKLTMIVQQLDELAARALRFPTSDPITRAQATLAVTADRLDHFLSFNASTGLPEMSALTMTQLASAVNAAYAAGSTADAVTYTPAGTGAVARSVQAKLRDMPQSLGDYNSTANAIASGGVFTKSGGLSADVWLWSRNLTGAKAVGADATLQGYSPSAYQFDIFSDDADAGSDFMIGFRVRHQFGGSATKGGREALSGTGWLTAATNAANGNRNYVGLQGKMLAQSGDGGTNTGAGALGAIFGLGGAVYAYAGATNLLDITNEVNTFTEAGSSAKHMAGLSIVGCQATRGATIDAGLRIGAQGAVGVFGPHIGWKWGVVFTDENGADPLYSNSTLIGTQFQVTKTILRGIDLSQFTMTEFILRGIYSKLTESQLVLGDSAGVAQIDIVGASTNASLLLRSRGTGSVYMGASDGTYMVRADRVASAVNYAVFTPAVASGQPTVGVDGTDTNIDLKLQGKGTGVLRFGTHTGGGDTVSNGYITIRDAAGNTRKLMTTA